MENSDSTAYGESDAATCSASLTMHPDLPTKAGFFWWRRVASDEWRMVQIVDWNNGGHTGTCYLSAYDVEHHDFGSRTMRAWSRFEDIGEWMPVPKPETLLLGVERMSEAQRSSPSAPGGDPSLLNAESIRAAQDSD